MQCTLVWKNCNQFKKKKKKKKKKQEEEGEEGGGATQVFEYNCVLVPFVLIHISSLYITVAYILKVLR